MTAPALKEVVERSEEQSVLAIATIIDPAAFSEQYAPVDLNRHEKWLTNKGRRIRKAIAKADQVLAAQATIKSEAVFAEGEYWRGILKERDLWIVELIRERDEAKSALSSQSQAAEGMAKALGRLIDYRSAEYVPNTLFETADTALSHYRTLGDRHD